MSGKRVVLVTAALVLGLASAGGAQVDPDLIGWWRLDEGQGKRSRICPATTTAARLWAVPNGAGRIGGA
jgi:hypothetical protein